MLSDLTACGAEEGETNTIDSAQVHSEEPNNGPLPCLVQEWNYATVLKPSS